LPERALYDQMRTAAIATTVMTLIPTSLTLHERQYFDSDLSDLRQRAQRGTKSALEWLDRCSSSWDIGQNVHPQHAGRKMACHPCRAA